MQPSCRPRQRANRWRWNLLRDWCWYVFWLVLISLWITTLTERSYLPLRLPPITGGACIARVAKAVPWVFAIGVEERWRWEDEGMVFASTSSHLGARKFQSVSDWGKVNFNFHPDWEVLLSVQYGRTGYSNYYWHYLTQTILRVILRILQRRSKLLGDEVSPWSYMHHPDCPNAILPLTLLITLPRTRPTN